MVEVCQPSLPVIMFYLDGIISNSRCFISVFTESDSDDDIAYLDDDNGFCASLM